MVSKDASEPQDGFWRSEESKVPVEAAPQGAAPAVFWICSLRMRMLCRCSGGSMAICSGVSCSTCMIRAAWGGQEEGGELEEA